MAKCFVAFFNACHNSQDLQSVPCFYETFIKGLVGAGNEVYIETTNIWRFNQRKCPDDIARKIKQFNPDVCFLFNNSFYDISHIVDCPIVVYEVDSFLFYKNKEVLYKNPNRYYYFVPQTVSFDVLQKELRVEKNRICYVPFFTGVVAKNEKLVNNICFIGTKFTKGDKYSPLHKFMSLNPSEEEKQQFKKCLDLITEKPYMPINEVLQNVGTQSEKILACIYSQYMIGFLSDVRRIKGLSAISDLGLSLYGSPDWVNDLAYNPDLILSYNDKKIVSVDDNARVYNSHKIGININNIQATSGFGWRVADVMASNACLVSEYKPDFATLFPDVKLPLFSSPDEARELCQKLLKDEKMRADIVGACHIAIDKTCRFEHALDVMQDFLGIKLRCADGVASNNKIIIESICEKTQSNFIRRVKQMVYSFGLFVVSIPGIHLLCGNRFRGKLKEKVTRYF